MLSMLAGLSGIPLGMLGIAVSLFAVFAAVFAAQTPRVLGQLSGAARQLRALRTSGSVDPGEVAEIFRSEPLKHLWNEYKETVHKMEVAWGPQGSPVQYRATVPAQTYFTREALVESRFLEDFMRHLPGVLRGLGLIGMFAGLLDGLGSFDATSTTAAAGLKPLVAGAGHGFLCLAAAFSLSMLVVLLSRAVLTVGYRGVGKLNQAIDALYGTGAPAEYLARLVRASEGSGAQAGESRRALVEDLKPIMERVQADLRALHPKDGAGGG
jgi:hypothetical protein